MPKKKQKNECEGEDADFLFWFRGPPQPPASKSLRLLPGLLPIPAKLTKNPFIAGAISRQKLISASALLEFSF